MRGVHFALLALLGVVALTAAACGGGGGGGGTESSTTSTEATETSTTGTETTTTAASTTLKGEVGEDSNHDAFTITLKTEDGSDVTTLAPGNYTLEVEDYSTIHNFHLTGPGNVDVATDVSETGEKTFDVTLEDGTYNYVCDPHSGTMNGSFTVSG